MLNIVHGLLVSCCFGDVLVLGLIVHLLFKKKRTKENSCVPMVASGKAERYIPQTPCYIAPGLN